MRTAIPVARLLAQAAPLLVAVALLGCGDDRSPADLTGQDPRAIGVVTVDTNPRNKILPSGGAGAGSGSSRRIARTLTPGGKAIISNGTVQLGVDILGQLNVAGPPSAGGVGFVGLRYVPTNSESTAPGCLCEGWGVADAAAPTISGFANNAQGTAGLSSVSFTSPDASTATSVVTAGTGGAKQLTVTHEFRPASETANLYEVKVTIENTGEFTIGALRYRRTMDWDIEPTPFNEYSTIQGTAAATNVIKATNNGFESSNPLSANTEILPGGTGDFSDLGPSDHGANFDFGFGALEPGEKKIFRIFYGAAGNEIDALAALGAVGAEVYSFGQPTTAGGKLLGTPNTFIFAFKGVGGVVIVPPKNAAPTSVAGGPYSGNEGAVIAFSGSGSSDPDGDALTYAWNLDNNGTWGDAADAALDASGGGATGAMASRAFGDNGVYTVGLKVSDPAALSGTSTAAVTVANVAPTITGFSVPPLVTLGSEGSVFAPVTGVSYTDPGAADGAFTVTIDCGHGITDPSPRCTYTAVGLYTVTVTVTDKDGGVSAPRTATVHVRFDFTGFLAPLHNLPDMNIVTAGLHTPLSFTLGGDRGLEIFRSPASSREISCGGEGDDRITKLVHPPEGSVLRFDATHGYTFWWNTDPEWVGTCREVTLHLLDGTDHKALFSFVP